jgi:hypothetical protein
MEGFNRCYGAEWEGLIGVVGVEWEGLIGVVVQNGRV